MTHRAVLITGGGTGIGWAISKAFLDAGDVVTICQNKQSTLDTLQPQLEKYGNRAGTVLPTFPRIKDASTPCRLALTSTRTSTYS